MKTAVAHDIESDHQESERRPVDLQLVDGPGQEWDDRSFDATQGRQIGSIPYDDATQGRQIGSRAYDDATRAP